MGLELDRAEIREIVIVGAGLEALSVVARLSSETLENCVVIDSSGEWLSSWDARCKQLRISSLRTPATLHPAPSPLELRSFAIKQGREHELQATVPGFAPTPTAALMRDFCHDSIVKKLSLSVRNVVKDTVTRLEPLSQESKAEQDSSAPRCLVHLSSGQAIPARAVIVATSAVSPVVPSWAKGHVRESLAGSSSGSPELCTFNTVDVGAAAAGSTLVVGGGMSAASLAVEATQRGPVTLLARRPLLLRPFDCDVAWWGNKGLNAFWREENPEIRMKACRQSRPQASLSHAAWIALVAAAAEGKIEVLEGCQVDSIAAIASGEGSRQRWEACITPTQGLPAAGLAQKLTPFQLAVVTARKLSGSRLSGEENQESPAASSLPQRLSIDRVWLSCGSAFDAESHPLLSSLQAAHPTRLVAGYPLIDPRSCAWPGVPVYIVGRGALVAMGPSAGGLAGMRLAAERVVRSIQRSNALASGKLPDWEAAVALLEAHRGLHAPPAAPGCLTVDSFLELEAEGPMWVERRVRASVAHPPHLVDVSDLPPAAQLPRHEVQKFSFIDDDFEVTVVLSLPEGVPQEAVRSLITEWSLEVWCMGQAGAYRLHVPRLYGRVLPARSGVRVNEKKKKVYVTLHKEKDAEWRFLKGAL